MRQVSLRKVVAIVIVSLGSMYLPSAFAQPNETGAVASNGNAVNNPGFDANGEALQKVITKIRGQEPQGVPNFAASKLAKPTSNGISFHGGAVMTSGININLIWYGNWNATQKTIISDMINSMGKTPYVNINSTYYDNANKKVDTSVVLTGQFTDNYSQGNGSPTSLSDAQILQIVKDAASNFSNTYPTLPNPITNSNAITLVLTSEDVKKNGFLSSYCGWHTYSSLSGTSIKYSFVGNPGTNLSCAAQTLSPNGDPGVDAMASVIAHEIVEATTDPELNAWFDTRGYENADKCAWTFGSYKTLSNGAKYNVTWGTRNFYIQRNWLNANGGLCTLSY